MQGNECRVTNVEQRMSQSRWIDYMDGCKGGGKKVPTSFLPNPFLPLVHFCWLFFTLTKVPSISRRADRYIDKHVGTQNAPRLLPYISVSTYRDSTGNAAKFLCVERHMALLNDEKSALVRGQSNVKVLKKIGAESSADD